MIAIPDSAVADLERTAPAKHLPLLLLWLWQADVVDDDGYAELLLSAAEVDDTPPESRPT